MGFKTRRASDGVVRSRQGDRVRVLATRRGLGARVADHNTERTFWSSQKPTVTGCQKFIQSPLLLIDLLNFL